VASTPLVTQPKFAQQLTANPSPIGMSTVDGGITRGFMIWEKPSSLFSGGGALGDGRDVINFLFNPSTVSTDYMIGNSSIQAAMMYRVPGDSGNLLAPLSQTVSWQLYFDRTFELLYGTPDGSVNDPSIIGVQADVYQFMQFTGVTASLDNGQATAVLGGPGATGPGASPTTGGIMMMMPCYVYFGNASNQAGGKLAAQGSIPATTQYTSVSTQLAFYGFISEWSVQYTHWTVNMIPIRAAINVSFVMLPAPSSSDTSAQNTWRDITGLQGGVTAPRGTTAVGSIAVTGYRGGRPASLQVPVQEVPHYRAVMADAELGDGAARTRHARGPQRAADGDLDTIGLGRDRRPRVRVPGFEQALQRRRLLLVHDARHALAARRVNSSVIASYSSASVARSAWCAGRCSSCSRTRRRSSKNSGSSSCV